MTFFFLTALTLFSATMVTHVRSPIHAILYLIWTFFNTALLVFTLGLDFFALIYIIIYVGAVAILFLFVIMTLNLKQPHLFVNVSYHIFFSSVLGVLFVIPLCISLFFDLSSLTLGDETFVNWLGASLVVCNLKAIGSVLYTRYVSCFILAGVILFISMVGAIMLTAPKQKINPRHQDIYAQVQRTPKSAVFLLSVPEAEGQNFPQNYMNTYVIKNDI